MIGKYNVEIYNNRVHYFLTIQRNITILQGDSATGKSELIRLISDYNVNGISSGITVKCDVKCSVLNTEDWDIRLTAMRGNIVFIDETASFLKTTKFAEKVKGSDNYFVIVTRDDLSQLPYSVDEIYGLKNVTDNSKYKSFKKTYNEMYKLYDLQNNQKIIPEKVIVEDSNSGYEFYSFLFPDKCVSAKGKSNIYKIIRDCSNERKLIIVDGAAFGPEMGRVIRYIREVDKNSVLFAPKSFEYLILKSGLIDIQKNVLEETFRYADSKVYMSWEEFFTSYLVSATQNTVFQYSKSKLKDVYKTEGAIKKINNVLPDKIIIQVKNDSTTPSP